MKRAAPTTGITLLILLSSFVVYILYATPFSPGWGVHTPSLRPDSTRAAPVGWREYRDFAHQFSLFYPETLNVEEYDEPGGGSTIVFQNAKAERGFQIFIVGYTEEEVSEERLKKDLPSGVQANKEDIMVDGAKGIAFYSQDLVLGETREAWFIKNGFLYEVTSPKPLEADLLEVLKTWEFLP